MGRLCLVHDVLDMQLCDQRNEKIGRADAVVLELREGRPPRVSAILIGGAVRAERIGRPMLWLRRTMRALFSRKGEETSRVPFESVRVVADVVKVDVDGRQLASGHLEQWLSDHVVCRIPGASGEHK